MQSDDKAELEVAVGVLQNAAGEVLIGQRPASGSLPGVWEFPGGKLAANETPLQALQRELHEELAIRVRYVRYLAELRHDYGDAHDKVRLFCWKVLLWEGSVKAAESQVLKWVAPDQLTHHGLLEADRPLVDILTAPGAVNSRPWRELVEKMGWAS